MIEIVKLNKAPSKDYNNNNKYSIADLNTTYHDFIKSRKDESKVNQDCSDQDPSYHCHRLFSPTVNMMF